MTPLTLFWRQFRSFFVAALEECSDEDFRSAWESSSNRTNFYRLRLMPSVAKNMKLVQRHELFKVDIALCKKSTHGHDVPMAEFGVRGTPYSLGDFLAWLGFVNNSLKELLEKINMRHGQNCTSRRSRFASSHYSKRKS